MRITHSVRHRGQTMDEKQQEPLDLVKDFQEYLNQQTHHVNMISGSVDEEKEPDDLQAAVGEDEQTGLEHASIEVSLDDGALANSFERTDDGKLKCRYCNYGSRGIQRLIEHIRIHTGEKPHRCHLCPFASAYERHLESHMRSHTGEKPYKCDLCSFRCSDRSNLSHHRRRRHKVLSTRVAHHSSLASKKILKRSSSLAYSRRHLISLSPPSMVVQKHLNGFPSLHADVYENLAKAHSAAVNANVQPLILDNPLDQLSTLAGQLANLPSQDPHCSAPEEQDEELSCREEKPMLISPLPGLPSASSAHPPSASTPDLHSQSTNSVSYSQPGTPVPASTSASAQTSSNPPETLYSCMHCQMYFADNILYTIHMGCHGYDKPFQCNVCGCQCRDQYDFACHFARGHNQP
ncbi:zinc finger protein Pegasus-like isoform X2 [Salminus brasiliensis]|uniref:zinc finger protein Pegasus-like isoform X2 n=1 Tax=Salminus brasiliensis TaxID=930266 RepID=UPI003B838BDE